MVEYDYLIISDGGVDRNNRGYGSYYIRARNTRKRISDVLELPVSDNNQAEYLALIASLSDLSQTIERAGYKPCRYSLEVRTDSQIVVKQLTGAARVNCPALLPLYKQALALIHGFRICKLSWQSRADTFCILGH